MNIVRTFQFNDEFKEKSVLHNLDATRMVLFANSSAFVLSFNPHLAKLTDQLCIDIQNIASCKEEINCSSEDSDEEPQTPFSFEEKLGKFFDRGIKCARGHQIDQVHIERFFVAVLKSKSCLVIYIDNYECLEKTFSFESLLINESERSSKVPLHSINSEKVQKQDFMNLFACKPDVCCVCWSPGLLRCEGNAATEQFKTYLAVSHNGGFITVWEADASNERFDLICGVDMGDNFADEIHSFSCNGSTYICTSLRDGRVCLLEFFTSQSGSTLMDVTFIWDEKDFIVAHGIVYIEQQRMLAVPKNQHLVLLSCEASDDNTRIFSPQILMLDTRYYISGIVPFQSELIVSVFDGSLVKVPLNGTKKFVKENISLPWNANDWNIYGVQASKNEIYLVVALYPSKFFCNRVVKQPSLVHYLLLKPVSSICNLVMDHSGPVHDIFDALCHLKQELMLGNVWPEHFLYYLSDVDARRNHSLDKLKVIRCLLCIQLLYLKTEDPETKEKMNLNLQRAEKLILTKHIHKTLEMVSSNKFKPSQPTEKLVLSLMKIVVETNSESPKSKKSVESCPVCSEVISLENYGMGACKNGHLFARCSQTLVSCATFPYRVCIVCKKVAIRKSDQKSLLLDSILTDACLYCDGYLKLTDGF